MSAWRNWHPELAAVLLFPILKWQGQRTRRVTPRLPEAPGARSGTIDPPTGTPTQKQIRLLCVGESPVAGVGVADQQQALTAQLARTLACRSEARVNWRALGQNGATVAEALEVLVPQLDYETVDILVIAFGVNDSTAFRSHRRWTNDMRQLITRLRQRTQAHTILLSGVPPLGRFPALPQPLRWVMGLKAKVLDQTLKQLALEQALLHVPLPLDPQDRALMASDGYHPSETGSALWASVLVEAVTPDSDYTQAS